MTCNNLDTLILANKKFHTFLSGKLANFTLANLFLLLYNIIEVMWN